MQSQGDRDQAQRLVREGQVLRRGLDVTHAGLARRSGEHLPGDIRTDNTGGDLFQRHGRLPGTAGHVESPRNRPAKLEKISDLIYY